MLTVLFYLSILFVSTFFVYISDKGKGRLERQAFLLMAFLLIFIPSAFRFDIGTDFLNYIAIYNNLDTYGDRLEPGFYLLNQLFYSIEANPQWIFISSAFIFSIVLFAAYPIKGAWILHFAAVSLLWFPSFNIIRQSLAIVFTLLATFCFFDKKYIHFFILSLIGVMFHFSAIFITTLGVLALIPIRNNLKTTTLPLVFLGMIALTYISMAIALNYIQQILNIAGLSNYAWYFNSSHFLQRDFGSGLGALVKILFSVYIILNAKSILRLNPAYWILIPLNFLYAVATILANEIVIFGRMQQVFMIAPIISLYILYLLPINKSKHKLVIYLFLTYLLLNFTKESLGLKTSYADPKLNPYQTVLLID